MNNFYKKSSKNYLKNIYIKISKRKKKIGPTQTDLAWGHAVQPN